MTMRNLTVRSRSVLRATVLRPSVAPVAAASGLMLTPVALLAGVLGAWRFSVDLGWTSAFFVPAGLLSRYQLWFSVAIVAQTSAFLLNRAMATQQLAAVASPPTEA